VHSMLQGLCFRNTATIFLFEQFRFILMRSALSFLCLFVVYYCLVC